MHVFLTRPADAAHSWRLWWASLRADIMSGFFGDSFLATRLRALAPDHYEFFDGFHQETRGVLVVK